MICDQLKNGASYRALSPRLAKALDFLRNTDLAQLPLGRHDIDGDNIFALVQEYTTKPCEECRWEAHRKYTDVQVVARGTERIGIAATDEMTVTQPYDAERDVAFFSGEGDAITLRAGMFAIFAPQDAHRPCAIAVEPNRVLKVVIKVANE